jgi:hypothetical protein
MWRVVRWVRGGVRRGEWCVVKREMTRKRNPEDTQLIQISSKKKDKKEKKNKKKLNKKKNQKN